MTTKALSVLLALAATPAWAALGEPVDSVSRDAVRLRGEVRESPRQGYGVLEIHAAGGTVVREYVDPSGLVFGVAWEGPIMPDLEPLLGRHYAAFRQAAGAGAHRRAPVVLRSEGFVVESGGHMRAFRGRAYLPGILPSGFDAVGVR